MQPEQLGLTSEEVDALTAQGKTNYIKSESDMSIKRIIFRNVFTYFNGIFALLTVLVITTGEIKNLMFLPIIIANTLIGIIQQLRSKFVLDKLALLDVSEYTAIRDGKEVKVPSDKLVEGDVILLESGQQIPADGIVLSGEAGVNESLLTGEADEIQKTIDSDLKSGSFVVSGKLTAKLTKVGADSYAAQITAKAKKTKEGKSEMIRDIERIILVAGIVVIPVGALLIYQSISVNEMSYSDSVQSMVGAVIGMIPEGLYLLCTVALALSAMRLAQKKVLLHDMRSVETLARVDVLCVDKTGTITSDDMSVSEVFYPINHSSEENAAAKSIIASYIRAVPDNNITMNALRDYFPESEPIKNKEVIPFDSKKKYSEVITEEFTYRLGAPEFLLTSSQLEENKAIIEERTGSGLRVLALTKGNDDVNAPILFVALQNDLRENVQDIFNNFREQGVEIKVISGDNPLTVSRVAIKAGVENAEKYIDLSTITSEEELKKCVTEYTVFGRVKPEQKKALVTALKENGLKVAMTGDGVNDILAMKEADCSIAMGTGSDAARQAAQVVLLDSDFSHMKEIVSEGRRDINNITRSASLFLYKNIFSLLLAIFSIILTLSYPLRPNQVSLISTFNIGIPAFLLALEPNEKKQEGSFIRHTLYNALPAAITSFFAIAVMVFFGQLFDISDKDISTASTYLLSVIGFMIIWQIIKPLNKWRVFVFAICIVGFLFGASVFDKLFDITHISMQAAALCAVFAIAEITIMRWLTISFDKISAFHKKKTQKKKASVA